MLCLICWKDFWYNLAPFVCNEPGCILQTSDVDAMIGKGVLPKEWGKRIISREAEQIWREYLRYERKPPPPEFDMRFYVDWWDVMRETVACPRCGVPTERRACPKCWSLLQVQKTNQLIIPTMLVGWTGSGKTLLTDAIAHEIEHNSQGIIGGYTGGPYRHHLTGDGPNTGGAWEGLMSGSIPTRTPGVMPVGYFSVDPADAATGLQSAIMPFRDYQGGLADLAAADRNELKRILQRARHLLLLIDSTDRVRTVPATALVQELTKAARSALRRSYVSVVLVKADSLPTHVDPGVRAEVERLLNLQQASVGPRLDRSDQYLLDAAKLFRTTNLLPSIGETGLIFALERVVGRDRIAFFVTSATGGPIIDNQGQKMLKDPWNPKRVLDPLVWRMQVD